MNETRAMPLGGSSALSPSGMTDAALHVDPRSCIAAFATSMTLDVVMNHPSDVMNAMGAFITAARERVCNVVHEVQSKFTEMYVAYEREPYCAVSAAEIEGWQFPLPDQHADVDKLAVTLKIYKMVLKQLHRQKTEKPSGISHGGIAVRQKLIARKIKAADYAINNLRTRLGGFGRSRTHTFSPVEVHPSSTSDAPTSGAPNPEPKPAGPTTVAPKPHASSGMSPLLVVGVCVGVVIVVFVVFFFITKYRKRSGEQITKDQALLPKLRIESNQTSAIVKAISIAEMRSRINLKYVSVATNQRQPYFNLDNCYEKAISLIQGVSKTLLNISADAPPIKHQFAEREIDLVPHLVGIFFADLEEQLSNILLEASTLTVEQLPQNLQELIANRSTHITFDTRVKGEANAITRLGREFNLVSYLVIVTLASVLASWYSPQNKDAYITPFTGGAPIPEYYALFANDCQQVESILSRMHAMGMRAIGQDIASGSVNYGSVIDMEGDDGV